MYPLFLTNFILSERQILELKLYVFIYIIYIYFLFSFIEKKIITQTSAHLECQEALSLFNKAKWQERDTPAHDQ